MNRKVFILEKGELGIFDETEYTEIDMLGKKNEAALQKCLEDFPELIPANQIDSEKSLEFLVVKAEAGVTPGSIDILMLDNQGVLNIIETKLEQNREIRRAVVGQALEYAAHLVMEWTTEIIREEGNNYWRMKGQNFDEMIATRFLNPDLDEEMFWGNVQENLEEMNIRIIIASGGIPKELRQVVEFVNRNSKFEMLALEVKLFADSAGRQVLVPYIIGATEKKSSVTGPSDRIQWTYSRLEEALKDEENILRKERFLELMEMCREMGAFNDGFAKKPSFRFHNKAGKNAITFFGRGHIYVGLMADIYGSEDILRKFYDEFNQLSGVNFQEEDLGHWKKPDLRIDELGQEEYEKLKGILKSIYDSNYSL